MAMQDFNYDHLDEILDLILQIYSDVSVHVLNILLDKYHLSRHFEALKKYLLLGQGDFIQYLMDSLEYFLN